MHGTIGGPAIVFSSLKRSLKFLAIFAALAFLSSGCGYHLGEEASPFSGRTVSVPMVEGDESGEFTAALVKAVCRSGTYPYRSEGSDLVLEVDLADFREENIGFRYDRKKDGKRRKSIIPVETRMIATAKVALIENCSGAVVLGPVLLNANVDFDHDYYSSRNQINVFSLGQLSDYDEAWDAAHRPLYAVLVQKIVDWMDEGW